jgi:hypothetical protein
VNNYALNDNFAIMQQCSVTNTDFEWEACHIINRESFAGTFGQHNPAKNNKVILEIFITTFQYISLKDTVT